MVCMRLLSRWCPVRVGSVAKVNLRDRVIQDLKARYPDTSLTISDRVMLALAQLDVYTELAQGGIISQPSTPESVSNQNVIVDENLLGSLADMVHTS